MLSGVRAAAERDGVEMTRNIPAFWEELRYKKVAVVGLGVSHFDLIRLMLHKGIGVTVLDRRDREAMDADYETLSAAGARFRLGDSYLSGLSDFDIVFRTPGLYYGKEELTKARQAGVAVTSEMEVFFALCPCRIYAVTGSDGKSTTTTIISELLKAEGKTVHLGGNLGYPLLSRIEEIRPEDAAVVELSSFQLISMRQSPDVAVITNVQPNHLDVHRDMQEYIDAKKNILLHQDAFSRAVLNLDNEITAGMAELVRGKLCFFSRRSLPQHGSYLDVNGNLCRVEAGKARPILPMTDIRIPGMHNVENYLTAIAAVGSEVSDETIRRVAREFGGVEHRIEFVRELDGVRYYNDSIASSPTRTIAGLNSFPPKTAVVILGGYDKKIPYAPLAPVLIERARAAILMGATGPKIEEALRECPGFFESGLIVEHAETMEQAVALARKVAAPGNVVTLSPASASFDLYRNFEERGRHFKQIVAALPEAGSAAEGGTAQP